MAKRCHPDLCVNKAWATQEFQELNADLKYRLNFKVEIITPKKASPPPPSPSPRPEAPKKTTAITVGLGFRARMASGGRVLIDLYVPKNIEKAMVVLLPDERGTLPWTGGGSMQQFNIDIPPGYKDGDRLIAQNLNFPCEVTLYHKA